jgi:hypothetical protein
MDGWTQRECSSASSGFSIFSRNLILGFSFDGELCCFVIKQVYCDGRRKGVVWFFAERVVWECVIGAGARDRGTRYRKEMGWIALWSLGSMSRNPRRPIIAAETNMYGGVFAGSVFAVRNRLPKNQLPGSELLSRCRFSLTRLSMSLRLGSAAAESRPLIWGTMGAEGTGKGNLREAGRGCFYRITQSFYSMRACSVILTNVGMDEGLLLVDFVPVGDRNLFQVLQQGRNCMRWWKGGTGAP